MLTLRFVTLNNLTQRCKTSCDLLPLRANRRRIIEALEAARNVAVFVLHDQDLECPEAEKLLGILHPETP
jgi:hypothetical protein